MCCERWSNEAATAHADIWPDQPDVPACTLRKWYPRPACGTAVKSVRISISVFGLVPTPDEPAECLPWTRRTGVCLCFPCFGNVSAHSGRRWPAPRVLRFLSHVWNSKLAYAFT